MEDEKVVDVERKLVGRTPYKYQLGRDTTTLEADSGFGRVGAKMDPVTGALMYDRYEDWITKERTLKEEIKETNIRFSDESGAMIHFQEDETVRLDVEGNVVEHIAAGSVSVENRSSKDRIWDLEVGLNEETGVARLDLRTVNAKEVEPGARIIREYQIRLHEPSIAIEEVISTHPDLPESRVVLRGEQTHTVLQLGLKNLAVVPYSDVTIRKAIPKDLKNVMFPGDTVEDVAIEEGELVWRIDELIPGEMRILRYEGDLDPTATDRIPTGDIRVKARGQEILTNIVVDSFEAMCRNLYFIEADETEEPGEWICRFVVENTSEFEVEVLRVEVKDPSSGRVHLNLDTTGIYVTPGGRWESDEWLVSLNEKPAFIKNLVLNIVPGLSKDIGYSLAKDGGNFYPASISFKKTFDKKKVEAKRSTDITANLVVENTGYADIEQIFIRDSLPRYFMPPDPSSIVIEKAGIPLSDNVGVHIEPDQVPPVKDQRFFIRIDNLSRFGGPLRAGERLAVRYTSTVHRPEPGETIEAPAEVDARTYLPGPVIHGEDVAGAPIIDVLQNLRKFSVGKSIEQGSAPGEYHIELLYRNRGSGPVKDLVLKDMIPENFKGGGYTLEPSKDMTPEGVTILEWLVPRIDAGDSVIISYAIKGEGEYHATDAQIFYNTGN